MVVYIVLNYNTQIDEVFDNEQDAKNRANDIAGSYITKQVKNIEKELKFQKQSKCNHNSMSGNGAMMKCNDCGYVKITQIYF